ncbi:MAG: hypothetical protein DWQ07_17360 [Chloroflexi bacterium]|nr:MAG: hypothetical protein DWQ07_17360 [Chloroflexota bacterium]MBL1195174.1 hypothetical protein [Chloroflexota bacterium]NOH12457.1 hypothetical protein [Chloroflexota bacterium]
MNDLIITILVLLILIELANLILTWFFGSKAARSYDEATRTQQRLVYMRIKSERDQSIDRDLPGGAYGWLSRQVKEEYGFSVEFNKNESITLESTPVFVARTSEGDSLVVSAFGKRDLKKRLQGLIKARGRLAKLTEESTVLDILKKAKQERKRSVESAGEFFDIEAQKADEELQVGWGDADVLHLSWVNA